MKRNKILAVVGPTGCGKTTLIKKLCESYLLHPIYEEWKENPYIIDSYRGSKHMYENQLWFIKNDISRFEIAINFEGNCIIDKLFIQNFAYISNNEFKRNNSLLLKNEIEKNIHQLINLDTLIIINIPTEIILKRISMRNRDYEKNITFEWIDKLNKKIPQIALKYSKLFGYKILYYDINNDFFNENEKLIKTTEIFYELFR